MMFHLDTTMLLLALVIAVLVATRPAPPRRRRPRSMRPSGGKIHPNARRAATLSSRRSVPHGLDSVHRNRWDRADIATGVGRDYAQPDPGLNHWPAPR